MLVLTRRLGEEIIIGDDITLVVVEIDRNKVKLGLKAPPGVQIWRKEIRGHARPPKRKEEQ